MEDPTERSIKSGVVTTAFVHTMRGKDWDTFCVQDTAREDLGVKTDGLST